MAKPVQRLHKDFSGNLIVVYGENFQGMGLASIFLGQWQAGSLHAKTRYDPDLLCKPSLPESQDDSKYYPK